MRGRVLLSWKIYPCLARGIVSAISIFEKKLLFAMFLSIDAGNSTIVFGLSREGGESWNPTLSVASHKNLTVLQLEKKLGHFFLENDLKLNSVTDIGLSTVVPDLEPILMQCCKNFFGRTPYLIDGSSYERLPVKTENPHEIGSDLMANITAAYAYFAEPCIVVDFGTALTFSIVDAQGKVIGVNIVPGIKTAINALFARTAKLPKVALEMPESVLGKNTVHSIQAGIFYGYTALVKGMLASIVAETNCSYKIAATGGLSAVMDHLNNEFDLLDRHLTLKGIYQITNSNRNA